MSVESGQTPTDDKLRKRVYPLRMETLPDTEDPKASNISPNIVTSTQTNRPIDNQSQRDIDTSGNLNDDTSNNEFEQDHDFRFKRHKSSKVKGVPSLGERLDNLQGMKKAKWVDNFDSSLPNENRTDVARDIPEDEERNLRNELPSSQPKLNLQSAPQLDHSQWQQQQSQQPIYYIPVPTSPVYGSQMPMGPMGSQYMVPNSSMQPFYQAQMVPGSSQLLPPPHLNSTNLQYTQRTRNNRRSIAEQRGRRLSIMSNRDQTIISPHKDIPENQFYRYLAPQESSEMQLAQLYSWCAMRSYNKMRHELRSQEKFNDALPEDFVDTKNVALSIIKDFVDDLRSGRLDIDWNAEDEEDVRQYRDEIRQNQTEEVEDTVLKNLFKDDEEDVDDDGHGENTETSDTRSESYYYTGFDVKRIPGFKHKSNKKKGIQSINPHVKAKLEKMPLLPNSKNIKNEQNLVLLQEKVAKLKRELADWVGVLDNQNLKDEWTELTQAQNRLSEESASKKEGVPADDMAGLLTVSDLEKDLAERMSNLRVHAHLISTHSDMLAKTTTWKQDVLSREVSLREERASQEVNSKQLLRGLSDALAKK